MRAKVLFLGSMIVVAGVVFGVRLCARPYEPPSAASISAGLSATEAAPNQSPLALPLTRPSIVVFKGERRLELLSSGRVVRRYRIALGTKPVGDKECATQGHRIQVRKDMVSTHGPDSTTCDPSIESPRRGDRPCSEIHRTTTPRAPTCDDGIHHPQE